MKKVISIIFIIVTLLAFASCSSSSTNRKLIINDNFNKAIIKLPDRSIVEVEIKNWFFNTYNDELVIISKDETKYMVNSVNCILIEE